MLNRRAHLLVAGRLIPLADAPRFDEDHPQLERSTVCVECGADLADAIFYTYIHLFRCACGSLYGLRWRSVPS